MIVKLLRLGRRQLHTIISRETIKPSTPTSSHIPSYIFSLLDKLYSPSYVPLILLYPKNDSCSLTTHDKVRVLKNSLSQSLTRYYPFAGRLLSLTTPYIDCNDEGVEFVEAEIHSRLDTFQHDLEAQDQLFADGLVWYNSPCNTILLRVQLNHFSCGGIGVAVSMSHLIGDGCTLASFVNYWAYVARYGSTDHKEVLPFNPHIIHFQPSDSVDRLDVNEGYGNRVARKFLFPNSKLNDLKNKVMALPTSGSIPPINNPTRVEVLTSLLYKTAVKATTTKYGFFEPSYLLMPVELRKIFDQKLPQTTLGKFFTCLMLMTRHIKETSLDVVIAEIKKEKVRLQQVQSLQRALENDESLLAKLGNEDYENVANRTYWCSSLCGFPFSKVDFGWGKPMVSTLSLRSIGTNAFVIMDTPHVNGITTTVLEKEDMFSTLTSYRSKKGLLKFWFYAVTTIMFCSTKVVVWIKTVTNSLKSLD